MKIEILGSGCPKCQKTEQRVKQALAELKLEAEVEHVTDPNRIADYGVLFTPALAIDGVVQLSGQVPSLDKIKALLITQD